MPNYSKNEVILVRYPFSNLSGSKVRPAVVVNDAHSSQDVIIVPLTSKVSPLLTGEFVLAGLENIWIECAFCGEARPLHRAPEFSVEIYWQAI